MQPVLKIKLLGDPAIIGPDDRRQEVRGHQTWAVLARILLSPVPLSRRDLAAELFPDVADPLGALRWSLAALRKALNSPQSLIGDPVMANLPDNCRVDVWQLDDDDLGDVEFGDLLSHVEPRSSPEFSTWLLIERQRIGTLLDAKLRRLVLAALAAGDHQRAITLAETLARRNAYEEGSHILLVKCLVAAGSYDAALAHVESVERLFETEFGEKPSAALRSAARRTAASPAAGVSPSVFVKSLIESGKAALSAGAADAGIDCLRRAVVDADMIPDRPLLCTAMLELGTALVHAIRGFDDEGSVYLHQAMKLAREEGVARVCASALRELGYVEALAGRRPAADAYLEEARQLTEDPAVLAGIHAAAGFNLVDWGKIDEGLSRYEEAIALSRSTGNRRREIWSLGLGARGLILTGRLEEAERWLRSCLALVEDERWVSIRPWPVALLGECRIKADRERESVRPMLEEAFALSCQLQDPCWEGAVARSLALADISDGRRLDALNWFEEASRRCMRDTNRFIALQVDLLGDRARLCRELNQFDRASAFAREWVQLAARTHMTRQITEAANFIATLS